MRTVLIVDDEARVVRNISRVLGGKGLKTFLAGDGEEGLNVYVKEKPEFVLLDLFLPLKSGLEVLEEIRKTGAKTKVFMVSAETGETYLKQAEAFGATGYILKPLDADKLFKIADLFLKWDDKNYKGFFIIGG